MKEYGQESNAKFPRAHKKCSEAWCLMSVLRAPPDCLVMTVAKKHRWTLQENCLGGADLNEIIIEHRAVVNSSPTSAPWHRG
eukprot:1656946-Karenia_brevis.AAC.1